ncbi:MAG: hypothetical protein HSCHL_0281 [Hydrogenibacillus schlegelii]|uniref:Uncharacterized protein n=1 Tax=Hydrogenibacillus schlegelii TaxID=1484 RepID=A0A2T5GDV5_HYDSH|nr:MAG: hypothetical protein HSCHL_0281 [Hydrogenibacillus schlegelii]
MPLETVIDGKTKRFSYDGVAHPRVLAGQKRGDQNGLDERKMDPWRTARRSGSAG